MPEVHELPDRLVGELLRGVVVVMAYLA